MAAETGFWRFALHVEDRLDLAEASLDELSRSGCLPGGFLNGGEPNPDGQRVPWEGYHARHWRTLTLAFRSLASRLYGVKTRSPGRMTPARADAILRLAVDCLRPAVQTAVPKTETDRGRAFSRQRFPRLAVNLPAYAEEMPVWWLDRLERHFPGAFIALMPASWGYRFRRIVTPSRDPLCALDPTAACWSVIAEDAARSRCTGLTRVNVEAVLAADRFWLQVFGSMLGMTLPAVCTKCGALLPLTKKLKEPRRGKCTRCSEREKYAKRKAESPKALQTKWREDKKRQRAKAKQRLAKKKQDVKPQAQKGK